MQKYGTAPGNNKKTRAEIMASKLWFVVHVLILVSVCSCNAPQGSESTIAKQAVETVNIMGDWQGSQTLNAGTKLAQVAQVIALGDGKFRANLFSQFDKRIEPTTVLDGRIEGRAVRFEPNQVSDIEWRGVIEAGKFNGSFTGARNGSFTMEKVVRQSSALGAKPPEGAIVLFDGTNLDQWEAGEPLGLVRIYRTLGRSKGAAAYLRCKVYSEKEQEATLELGSNDGVKVWLNGQAVHSNNILRMWKPDDDKVRVTLKQGWNALMLKVTTKGGPWGVSTRFVDEDGKTLHNVWEKDIYSVEGNQTRVYLDVNGNYLTAWEISGPYKQQGKDVNSLFDIVFAPEEKDDEGAKWQAISREYFEKNTVKWKLVDGAMEVNPGTGSIVSKQKFKDFRLHLEFRTPFMAAARGQKRGNSGVYLQGKYEVQVLDSYGLKGKDNECGGIYEVAAPLINMCAPPLQWQSYDIIFCSARFDKTDKKTKDACITAVHNGVKIQDNVTVSGPTGYPQSYNENEPGGILLQDHNDSVQYRNIWVVKLSEGACN